MAEVEWPAVFFVRCEEYPERNGPYLRLPDDQHQGGPIYKNASGKAGSSGWLFRGAGGCWGISACELEMRANMARIKSVRVSERPLGDNLWCTCKLGILTGTVVSLTSKPALPEWAEDLWDLQWKLNTVVNDRQDILRSMTRLRMTLGRCSTDDSSSCANELPFQRSCIGTSSEAASKELDLELHAQIIAGSEQISSNRECLVFKSQGFDAVLQRDLPMQNGTSGQVTHYPWQRVLDVRSASVVDARSLLSFLHSEGFRLML